MDAKTTGDMRSSVVHLKKKQAGICFFTAAVHLYCPMKRRFSLWWKCLLKWNKHLYYSTTEHRQYSNPCIIHWCIDLHRGIPLHMQKLLIVCCGLYLNCLICFPLHKNQHETLKLDCLFLQELYGTTCMVYIY